MGVLISSVIPVVIVVTLKCVYKGFDCFSSSRQRKLGGLILGVTLPTTLFISVVGSAHTVLTGSTALATVDFVNIVIVFVIDCCLYQLLFRHDVRRTTIYTLVTKSPAVNFLKFTILSPVCNGAIDAGLIVTVVSVIIGIIAVPVNVCLVGLNRTGSQTGLDMRTGGTIGTETGTGNSVALSPTQSTTASGATRLVIRNASGAKGGHGNGLRTLLSTLGRPVY